MRKRGQITIYIVLGIIAVALVVFFVSVGKNLFISQAGLEAESAMLVPEKAREVYSFVQGCARQVTEDGISKMGIQGGYIELPESASASLANELGGSLEIIPNSGLKTAYWYSITPNGLQKNSMPSLQEMEIEIADYIESNLPFCTQNFTLFAQYNISAEEIDVIAGIKDDYVSVKVDYPLKIQLYDFEYTIPSVLVDIDSEMGTLYGISQEIISASNRDYYLEEKTIDALAMYSGIPFSGTDFSCSPNIWTKSKVLQELKKALAMNIPFIKIKGTKFGAGEKYFEWDALKSNQKDVSVNFRYSKNWPVSMEVYPSDGEVLKSEAMMDTGNPAMGFLISLFCINSYNFVYDIRYPVLITLINENGEIFQFATQVIIDNNQPRENKLGTLDIAEEDALICGNAIKDAIFYVDEADAAGSLKPVSGAEIKLKCITSQCPIGETNSRGALKAKVPQCANALLTVEKQGYHPSKEIVSTVNPFEYEMMIEPYKTIDYEIKIIEDGFEREVLEGETPLVEIINEDMEFSTTLSEPSGKVRLIKAGLALKSSLITEGFDITIKGKEITHCYTTPTRNIFGLLGAEEEKCTTAKTDDMVLNQVIRGGSQYLWEAGREELYGAKKVTFYIPAGKIPDNMDELEQVYAQAENPLKAIPPKIE